MKEKILYAVWACLYILCVGLGTADNPQGVGKLLLTVSSVLFFVPGGILVGMGIKNRSRKTLFRVRLVSICSLSLTLILLVVNFLCANTVSEATGDVLYEILNLVSAPMLCSQFWVLSLFLWACLLMASCQKLPKE